MKHPAWLLLTAFPAAAWACNGGNGGQDGYEETDSAEQEDMMEDDAGADTGDGADGADGDEEGDMAGDIPTEPRDLGTRLLLGEGGFFGVSGVRLGAAAGHEAGSFAVAAHYADLSDGTGEEQPGGRLYVFHHGGFPETIEDAALVLQPPDGAVGGGFGYALAEPCDLDGDGALDLAVGNHLYSDGAASFSGRAVVFWGDGSDGLSMERFSFHRLSDDLRRQSDSMGQTVLCADFNGDGLGDLLATGQNAGRMDTGMGAIFYGTDAGLPEFQDAEIYPLLAASRQYFGCSSLFEDLDGDGSRDLAVGGWGLVKGSSSAGPHTGGVFIFPGGADWSLGPSYGLFPDLDTETNMGMDMVFFRVGENGFLAVSAPDYPSEGRGAVMVYAVGFGGFQDREPQTLLAPEEALDWGFGQSLAFVPDFFGMGRGALVVGMKYADASPENSGTGAAAVFAFDPSAGLFLEPPEILTAPDPKPMDTFGCAVVALDDVDGDGLGDFFMGMESHIEGDITTGTQTGAVLFYY
jgi:hypothetical protein